MDNTYAYAIKVHDLWVVASEAGNTSETPIVKGVSFQLRRGEVLALIGESGSGKTTIALSLMGYARSGCKIAQGEIEIAGQRVDLKNVASLKNMRGKKIAYVAQSAASAFNPARTIQRQIIEAARKSNQSRDALLKKIETLCAAMALPNPAKIANRYSHQLSGGQLQRLMIVMALINDPEIIVLDEPTTALDVSTQLEVLRCIKKAITDLHISAVYVSHDLAVVAQVADHIAVLKDGKIQESRSAVALLAQPDHPYTKSLLDAAAPREPNATATAIDSPFVLSVERVFASYGAGTRREQDSAHAVKNVSFDVRQGEIVGIIGESGSGKTTLASVIAGLLAPVKGQILLNGAKLPALAAQRSPEQLRRIQMVFQNADGVLNPRHRIGDILMRPLAAFGLLPKKEHTSRMRQLLDQVKLPSSVANRYAWELSGGQRQRVNLARALAAQPDLILCDEVTSALDTVVGAAILDLLVELRKELGLSCVFISHDIATVKAVCDSVTVMYLGAQVDQCASPDLDSDLRNPYTKHLIRSVPQLRKGWLEQASTTVIQPFPDSPPPAVALVSTRH